MAKIVFFMLSQQGHLNASLKLAKDLQAAGHDVLFLCTRDDQEFLLVQQMECLPVLEGIYPKGFQQHHQAQNRLRRFLELRRTIVDTSRRLPLELESIIQEYKPDLFIIDSIMAYAAFIPCKSKISVVILSSLLPTTKGDHLPPLVTRRLPPRHSLDRLCTSLVWSWVLFKRFWVHLFRGSMRNYKKMAHRCGFDWGRVNRSDVFLFDLPLPKLILCPECFDFARSPSPDRYYIEASIDWGRQDAEFPWSSVSDQKKIVYCSLGSQSYCYDNGRAFFLRVMNAFEELEGYQLILSIGGNPAAEDLLSAHGDMIVIRYAPQLDILRRATLMITHGGLNSIKECIYLGVPMLVFPGLYDQFGNAARVLYHGLGYVGHMTRTASKEIRAMVLSIENDCLVRSNIQSMREKFVLVEEKTPSIGIIEKLINKKLIVETS